MSSAAARTHQCKVKTKILLIAKALQRRDILFMFPFHCLCTNSRTKCSCLCYTQTSRLKTPSCNVYLNTKKFEKTAPLLLCLPFPHPDLLCSWSSLFKTSALETDMLSQKQLFKTICGRISLTWKPGGRVINENLSFLSITGQHNCKRYGWRWYIWFIVFYTSYCKMAQSPLSWMLLGSHKSSCGLSSTPWLVLHRPVALFNAHWSAHDLTLNNQLK